MFKEIDASNWNGNVFHKIGKEWMLVSVKDQDKANAMTASWGGMGVLWNKQVVFIFIRPQRYTKQLLDVNEHFALSFYDESKREMLKYMGKATGAKEDKIKTSNLHILIDHAPYFEEAKEVIIARKLFAQEIDPECILDAQIDKSHYPDKDYHILYVGEIEKVLIKKDHKEE